MWGIKDGRAAGLALGSALALLGGAAAAAPAAPVTPAEAPVMAAAELRVGLERLAKLCVEHSARVDPLRAQDELARERQRVVGALGLLRADGTLTGRPCSQLLRPSLPDPRMQDDLELARNQWVLFRAALDDRGRVKDPRRLPQVATTADRIAQSLLAIAQRAMRQATPEALARRT